MTETEYEYPDPGLLIRLRELGLGEHEAMTLFYELRSYLLKECKLWEGPMGDYYLLEPSVIGADK